MICPRFLEELYLFLHRRTYASRSARATRFPMRVVSIGNLSMGGTGKTPLVEYLVRKGRAKRPMVVLRGYGAGGSGLVSDGVNVLSTYKESGDEAMLLAEVPGLRVAAGKDRAALISEFGRDSDFILLDDAFQNPSVARDFELVLIDASIPMERLRVAPCGKFRERLDALSRADAVLLTRADQGGAVWQREIGRLFPELPVFQSEHRFAGLGPLLPGAENPAPLPGSSIHAFCGIGNPHAFFQMLAASFELKERRAFSDHHAFKHSEIRALQGAGPWVTTAKDAVRIRSMGLAPEALSSIWIARLELCISLGEDRLCSLVFGDGGT